MEQPSEHVTHQDDRPPKLTDPYWDEGLRAIQCSVNYSCFEDFNHALEEILPQNSATVRAKYRRYIIRWFFPDRSLDQISVEGWRTYRDHRLLADLARYQYFTAEPVVARFLDEVVGPTPPGTLIPTDQVQSFIAGIYGERNRKAGQRLALALIKMGFLKRSNGGLTRLSATYAKTSVIMVLHYLFFPSPQTVSFSEICNNPFWLYLGVPNASDLRQMVYEAVGCGALAKFVTSDQLDQITSRYGYREFLRRAISIS